MPTSPLTTSTVPNNVFPTTSDSNSIFNVSSCLLPTPTSTLSASSAPVKLSQSSQLTSTSTHTSSLKYRTSIPINSSLTPSSSHPAYVSMFKPSSSHPTCTSTPTPSQNYALCTPFDSSVKPTFSHPTSTSTQTTSTVSCTMSTLIDSSVKHTYSHPSSASTQATCSNYSLSTPKLKSSSSDSVKPSKSTSHSHKSKCKRHHQQYWVPSLCLLESDRRILYLNAEWLNDTIINAAQKLLSKSEGLQGFQNTLLGKGYQFKRLDPKGRPFVQILHINSNHWATTTNVGCEPGEVLVFDSLYNYISLDTKKQICSFWRPRQEVVQLGLANMQRQPDSSSCGLFAIAVATAIAHGNNPPICCNWEWEASKMREHLRLSLEKEELHEFPMVSISHARKERLKKCVKEQIHCICRMPNDPRQEMIQCGHCLKWFHLSCCNINTAPAKGSFWACALCTAV